MSLNPYAVGAILHAEIVGPVRVGHGQIDSLGDAQRYFNELRSTKRTTKSDYSKVDVDRLRHAFLSARATVGDRGSTDLYIADPRRNAVFLSECHKAGIRASDFDINKTLFNARKNKHLTGLKSKPTSIEYSEFAFASEFAATQIRYRSGASIDDILCDPPLATEFDSIARGIAPGYSSFEYRWAILSIRKAGRHQKLPRTFKLPEFVTGFRLLHGRIDQVPEQSGVYLLFETQKLLYTRWAQDLRHAVGLHRQKNVVAAISDKLWRPNPDNFVVDFAVINQRKTYLQAIERKLVEERNPVFNIPRTAA